MLCVATGVTSISVDGVEYEVEDALVEIPDTDYKKIIHHQGIRAATREEIAALERMAAAKREEEARQQAQTDQKAAEEAIRKEAAAKKAADKAVKEVGVATEPEKTGDDKKPEEGAGNGGK